MGRTLSPILSLPGLEIAVRDSSMPRRRRKLIAFGWYGGKFNHLEWLLPLLPQRHHHCEPFARSAAVST
jgi:DNA adenine methylase